MLKRAICAKFMMINIPVHKNIFFLAGIICSLQSAIEIHIPDLSEQYQRTLMEVWMQNKKHHIVIDIQPGQPFKLEVIPEESLFDSFFAPLKKVGKALGLTRKMLFWTSGSLVGSGALSYVVIFYFIYRIYRIAKKLYVLCAPFLNEESEDTFETVDRLLFRSGTKQHTFFSDHERHLLHIYLKLTLHLKKLYIRQFFPYNEQLEMLIEKYCTESKQNYANEY